MTWNVIQNETIPMDAPKPTARYRYIVVGKRKTTLATQGGYKVEYLPLPIEQQTFAPGTILGEGTYPDRGGLPVYQNRWDYQTGATRSVLLYEFEPAEGAEIFDIGRIAAKVGTGEVRAEPIDTPADEKPAKRK